ncbi:MAG TPA: phosphatase PAP2-related protein [Bdellovibrionales bacterium]|nr:phosphatase PAP2-related protein [Bdellovibrionales bacterium]
MQDHKLKRSFWRTAAFLFAVLAVFGNYLEWNERRTGAVLQDPVLAVLPSMDLAWPIFFLIYGMLLLAVFIHRLDLQAVTDLLRAYAFLNLLRMTMMFLTPLEAPEGLVILRDPFVELLIGGRVFVKDLFFSGHTSFLFLISLSMPTRAWRTAFFTGTFLVGSMLLIQHAHYTVDVVAAPFFSAAALNLSLRWRESRAKT